LPHSGSLQIRGLKRERRKWAGIELGIEHGILLIKLGEIRIISIVRILWISLQPHTGKEEVLWLK